MSYIYKNKMEIMIFIQKYWLPLLLLGVIIFILIKNQSDLKEYKAEVKLQNKEIKKLEIAVEKDLKLINNLKKRDTVYIDRIKEIKTKANENIKFVDTMSISDMQSFYTNRYPDN